MLNRRTISPYTIVQSIDSTVLLLSPLQQMVLAGPCGYIQTIFFTIGLGVATGIITVGSGGFTTAGFFFLYTSR
jgi:hypothetical protein